MTKNISYWENDIELWSWHNIDVNSLARESSSSAP